MTQMRVLRIREIILAGAFLISVWGAYPALGQPTDREYDRLESRVNRIDDQITGGAIELERRLSSIESNQREINGSISNLVKLGMGILASVTGLIIQSLWGLIVGRRNANNGK